jgi:hypothetical protein
MTTDTYPPVYNNAFDSLRPSRSTLYVSAGLLRPQERFSLKKAFERGYGYRRHDLGIRAASGAIANKSLASAKLATGPYPSDCKAQIMLVKNALIHCHRSLVTLPGFRLYIEAHRMGLPGNSRFSV